MDAAYSRHPLLASTVVSSLRCNFLTGALSHPLRSLPPPFYQCSVIRDSTGGWAKAGGFLLDGLEELQLGAGGGGSANRVVSECSLYFYADILVRFSYRLRFTELAVVTTIISS